MALSYIGWFDGITALCVVLSCGLFGIVFSYKSIKTGIKLLLTIGLSIFFCGLIYLVPVIDLFTIIFTGNNVRNPYLLIGSSIGIGLAPSAFFSLYGGTELLKIRKRKILVQIYLILRILL